MSPGLRRVFAKFISRNLDDCYSSHELVIKDSLVVTIGPYVVSAIGKYPSRIVRKLNSQFNAIIEGLFL